MLKSRFLQRLYAGYGLLILLAMAIVGEVVVRSTQRDSEAATERSLRISATLLRELASPTLDAGREGNPATLQAALTALAREVGTRYTVIAADGVVLGDSERDPARMDNHAGRPEVVKAREAGIGTSRRFSHTVGKDMMYVALRVPQSGPLLGFARASLPMTIVQERLGSLRAIVTLGAATSALIALVLGFFLARLVTRPLTRMTAVANSMAAGDYEQRLPVVEHDEIGVLAQSLNRLAASCRERTEMTTTDRNKVLAILGSMVEGVVAVDAGERIMHMNAAAAWILGTKARIPSPNTENRKIWEVTRVTEVCEILSRTLSEACEQSGELRVVVPPRDRHVEMHATPLRDGDGALVGAVVMLHDVTELRRLEAIRRDFVANVSHELKTPITAIRGIVETVLDDPKMDPVVRGRFLANMHEQSLRLSTLVTDLLTLSRLESETGAPEFVRVDLRAPVRDSVRSLRQPAESKGIGIAIDVPDRPVLTFGEEESLRLLVQNLLDNAVKYSGEGDRVTLTLTVDDAGTEAVLTVQDTGIGMEQKHLDRIFQRFYRVDKARSRELGGTGLGLSIVRHVCLTHGGEVTVDSVAGEGSTFTVRLPLASAPTRVLA